MKTTKLGKARRCVLGLTLGLLVGCGPAVEVPAADGPTGLARSELKSANGISVNGISVNGISVNGISVNGLTTEALTAESFSTWFEAHPTANGTLMHYLVLCGLGDGATLSYTSTTTGQHYTWEGQLGLTPRWASGAPPPETEQQLMTACLAAHANKYGLPVAISILGPGAKKQEAIPYTRAELETYSREEACFFGNLFNGEGLFVGSDKDQLDSAESSARACGLTSGPHAVRAECSPFVHVGSCARVCRLDKSRLFYESCMHNGRVYRPLTTRLRPQDVYRCGDGVCQFTEQCGTGKSYDSCRADCGICFVK